MQKNIILLTAFLLLVPAMVSATGLTSNLVMTGQTTGNMTCWSSGQDEWKIYDHIPNDANKWTESQDSDGIAWMACDFGISVNATNASIRTGASSSRNPLAFTIEGSNDNSSWTVLHSHSNTLGLDSWTDIDNLNNSGTSFRYFKLNVTTNEGSIFVDVVQLNITADPNLIALAPVIGYAPAYDVSDIPVIAIDFVGTYFVEFVAFAGLIALVVIFIWFRRKRMNV